MEADFTGPTQRRNSGFTAEQYHLNDRDDTFATGCFDAFERNSSNQITTRFDPSQPMQAAELPQASVSPDGRTLCFEFQQGQGTQSFDARPVIAGSFMMHQQRFEKDGSIKDFQEARSLDHRGQKSGGERTRQRDESHGDPVGPGEQVPVRRLYDYFIEHGFSKAQAAGILGNMKTESNFRTNAYNPREKAIGLCQWEDSRRTALERFATQQGKPVSDWHVQADFIMHELGTTEKRAYAALKTAQTPEQAAKIFQSKYERSAALTNRATNAREIYNQL
ncbi:MAG TPA: phage tail tip lysozyme [Drouetiella sp.]|jgi:Phage tail lysozyme